MKVLKKGFTLVELILVIGIIAILIVIAFPRFNGYTEKVREQVCETNRRELKRMYNAYLIIEDRKHEENIFEQYLNKYGKDICPSGGAISYDEEKIKCSNHDGNEDDGEVPYIWNWLNGYDDVSMELG